MIQKSRVRLVEKYSRGRWQNRLIDEYELGNILLEGPFYISGETVQKIPFDLPFTPLLSKMDQWESTNILMQGLVKSADRKSTRLNSSHVAISYAVFCWKTQSRGRDGVRQRLGRH